MTLKQMAKECKKIWIETIKSENKDKPEWADKYENSCPACQYVFDKYGFVDTTTGLKCKECPLLGLWGGKTTKCPCEFGKHSPYKLYRKRYSDNGYGTDDNTNVIIAGIKIITYLENKFGV